VTAGDRTRLAALLLLAGAAPAAGEPIFLSRQYARCTTCHYSPTGGGLLTPYGRSLSREELSTWGRSDDPANPGREQQFAYGLLGNATGPVSLGIELRPAHLGFDFEGVDSSRDLLMNADLSAAMRSGGFTLYAELGRQPRGGETQVKSFEHWIGYQRENGLGLRVGRFLPAYGIKLADHTSFTRSLIQLDNQNQVYALELGYNSERHLVQASVGPGLADDVGDSALRAFTASARWQFDLRPNAVLVASGLYRDASGLEPKRGSFGLAAGLAPLPRLTLLVQGDKRLQDTLSGSETAYTALGEVAFEAYRGVWLEFAPQLATAFGDSQGGATRLAFGLNLLPRTHWNLVLFYYRDKDRLSGSTFKTWLAQLHLYL